MNTNRSRHWFVYLIFVAAILVLAIGVISQQESPESVPLSQVAEYAKRGQIETVVVRDDDRLEITLTNDEQITSIKDASATAPEQLATFGVTADELTQIEWLNQKTTDWQAFLLPLIMIIFLVVVLGSIYMMMRNAQGGNNQAMSFGKSRARMIDGSQPSVTFDDVAGADEAKEELKEVVEFLREPEKFIQLGARIPKGVLLVGPPGTGKTLLSKAVAGEAGVPFFSISGSEFVEMFVGVGASRVRDLFEQAKKQSPCIIFVDEVDAVGRQRGAGLGGSHDEREQTLNQILVEMDGFGTDTNVIVIAATNRPDILDPALLRPGRFDRRVVMDRPDIRGREAIFRVHVRGKPLGDDVDLGVLAGATPGFVGADIENTVNEAAILAARYGKKIIDMTEFEQAIERVVMGPERRSRIISEKERRIVAYHEAGHAVAAYLLPNCEPVLKVTIIPRSNAGGYTWSLSSDNTLVSRSKFLDDISMALGGRIAEELVFSDITTGASGDLQQVTRYARDMVTRYGMSDRLGPMSYGQKQELVFLGREISEQRDYSESVAEEIDSEVRRIVSEAYERTRTLLTDHRDDLELIAETLIEVETLNKDQFERLMEGKPLVPEVKAAVPEKKRQPEPEKSEQSGSEDLDLPPAPAPA